MPTQYDYQVEEYWQAEARKAYQERKRKVWEVYQREGVKPWMQYQVAPQDLPFKVL